MFSLVRHVSNFASSKPFKEKNTSTTNSLDAAAIKADLKSRATAKKASSDAASDSDTDSEWT